jgi:hypothetical protein
MKILVDTVLTNFKGDSLKAPGGQEFTLKDAAIEALLATFGEADARTTGTEKFKRYNLAQKVHAGGEVDLTPEEVSLIKERVGTGYNAAVVGAAYLLLNG